MEILQEIQKKLQEAALNLLPPFFLGLAYLELIKKQSFPEQQGDLYDLVIQTGDIILSFLKDPASLQRTVTEDYCYNMVNFYSQPAANPGDISLLRTTTKVSQETAPDHLGSGGRVRRVIKVREELDEKCLEELFNKNIVMKCGLTETLQLPENALERLRKRYIENFNSQFTDNPHLFALVFADTASHMHPSEKIKSSRDRIANAYKELNELIAKSESVEFSPSSILSIVLRRNSSLKIIENEITTISNNLILERYPIKLSSELDYIPRAIERLNGACKDSKLEFSGERNEDFNVNAVALITNEQQYTAAKKIRDALNVGAFNIQNKELFFILPDINVAPQAMMTGVIRQGKSLSQKIEDIYFPIASSSQQQQLQTETPQPPRLT